MSDEQSKPLDVQRYDHEAYRRRGRYECCEAVSEMVEESDGSWVRYEDYAATKAALAEVGASWDTLKAAYEEETELRSRAEAALAEAQRENADYKMCAREDQDWHEQMMAELNISHCLQCKRLCKPHSFNELHKKWIAVHAERDAALARVAELETKLTLSDAALLLASRRAFPDLAEGQEYNAAHAFKIEAEEQMPASKEMIWLP